MTNETASNAGPVLFIAELDAQRTGWPDGLCAELVACGLRVIRFDDRDAAPSTLSDVAAEAVGLLDALGLERAHVAGVAAGGFVAQTLALEHPRRVRSLTSLMSSPGDRTARLRTLAVPTLVVHGTEDRRIDISDGRATAAAIPGAELVEIRGVGHDLPRPLWPLVAERIAELVQRVTAEPRRA